MKPNLKAFWRGFDWAERRKELRIQRAFTPQHLKVKEGVLEGALTARRTGKGPDNEHIADLMRDWLLIHEELEGS